MFGYGSPAVADHGREWLVDSEQVILDVIRDSGALNFKALIDALSEQMHELNLPRFDDSEVEEVLVRLEASGRLADDGYCEHGHPSWFIKLGYIPKGGLPVPDSEPTMFHVNFRSGRPRLARSAPREHVAGVLGRV